MPQEQAAADYAASARAVAGVADYVAVNVSSPNTPGLRDLQAADRLRPVLTAVRAALDEGAAGGQRVPLLVKIAPDLADADVDAVADLAVGLGLDGIIATNTTVSRDGLASSPAEIAAAGAGGLSGPPLRRSAEAVLRRLRARAGDRLVLIAAGGIETPDDAWERLRAGATLVQAYTGFVYGGPLWPRRIHTGLAQRARAAGLSSVASASASAGEASAGEASAGEALGRGGGPGDFLVAGLARIPGGDPHLARGQVHQHRGDGRALLQRVLSRLGMSADAVGVIGVVGEQAAGIVQGGGGHGLEALQADRAAGHGPQRQVDRVARS